MAERDEDCAEDEIIAEVIDVSGLDWSTFIDPDTVLGGILRRASTSPDIVSAFGSFIDPTQEVQRVSAFNNYL